MASFEYDKLYEKYKGFYLPRVLITLGGTDVTGIKDVHVTPADLDVELTCDYKASIATFSLKGIYDDATGAYYTDKLKKSIALGTDVLIELGYDDKVREVFRGYIARVEFVCTGGIEEGVRMIRITAMDVKGQMMANSTSKRLKAKYYCDAVKEIFEGGPYQDMKKRKIISDISVANTPDKPEGGGNDKEDRRIEMVAESDYEFVVKAAKRFNYEFFSIGGNIAFRKAKANSEPLIELSSYCFESYEMGYDITGLVETVNVRTVDVGKGSRISVDKKNTNKISLGSKAKPLVKGQIFAYLDPTSTTQDEAKIRAQALLDEMSYRLGTITATLPGLPEIVPGRFIKTVKMGEGASNTWYVTDVTHMMSEEGEFFTTISGKAAALQDAK